MLESILFGVTEVPVPFPDPPKEVVSFREVIEDTKLDWNVKKDTGYKMIMRTDREQILSIMSNDYKIVTNKELIDTAQPILDKHKAKLLEAITLGDGQKTIYKWTIPHIKIKVAEGDVLNPEIIIKNSYDGSLQVHILAGAFRLVCSNGLVIGVTLGKKNYKHNVNNKNLDFLDEAISNTIDHSLNVGSEFELLADTALDDKHIMQLVELFPSQMSQFLFDYLIARKPQNYWDLLNAATFIATHKMKRNNESTHKLENKIYTTIKNIVSSIAEA